MSLVRAPTGATTGVLWREGFYLLALLWIQTVLGSVSTVTYLGLAMWALADRDYAIQALTITVLLGSLNPGIFPDPEYGSAVRWLVLIAAAARVHSDFLVGKRAVPTTVVCVLVFSCVALTLSAAFGYDPAVSAFKVLGFLTGASTAVLGMRHSKRPTQYWLRWFYTLYVVVVISSAPLLLTHVGYLRNGHGFQGIFGQPQTFGVLTAPLFVIAVRQLAISGTAVSFAGPVTLAGLLMLIASESRTAASALLFGAAFSICLALLVRRDWLREISGRFGSRLRPAGICVVVGLAVLQSGKVVDRSTQFLTKYGNNASAAPSPVDIFWSARGRVVDEAWANFVEHPWTGIGFGLPSDPDTLAVERDPLLGLPISASSEKGFLPTAVLEETGILGATALLVLLVSLIAPVVVRGDLWASWLLCTTLFINSGEMVFFALSGLGMHVWLLIGLATAASGSEERSKCVWYSGNRARAFTSQPTSRR